MEEMAAGVGEEALCVCELECPRPNKSPCVLRVTVNVPERTELCAKYMCVSMVQIPCLSVNLVCKSM